jgi:hypothetical protein
MADQAQNLRTGEVRHAHEMRHGRHRWYGGVTGRVSREYALHNRGRCRQRQAPRRPSPSPSPTTTPRPPSASTPPPPPWENRARHVQQPPDRDPAQIRDPARPCSPRPARPLLWLRGRPSPPLAKLRRPPMARPRRRPPRTPRHTRIQALHGRVCRL